eukprot:jgi/Mesvir1/12726/Mv22475-RA.1
MDAPSHIKSAHGRVRDHHIPNSPNSKNKNAPLRHPRSPSIAYRQYVVFHRARPGASADTSTAQIVDVTETVPEDSVNVPTAVPAAAVTAPVQEDIADVPRSSPPTPIRLLTYADGRYVGVDRDTNVLVAVPSTARSANERPGTEGCARDLLPRGLFDVAQRAFSRKGTRADSSVVRSWIARYVNEACPVDLEATKDETDVVLCNENWSFTRTAVDFVTGEDDKRTVFARAVGDLLVILAYPDSMKNMIEREAVQVGDRYWFSMDLVSRTGEKVDNAYRNRSESDVYDSVELSLRKVSGGVPRAWAVSEEGLVLSDRREGSGSYAVNRKRARS